MMQERDRRECELGGNADGSGARGAHAETRDRSEGPEEDSLGSDVSLTQYELVMSLNKKTFLNASPLTLIASLSSA